MTKVRVSFDFDLAKINPDASGDVEQAAIETVETLMLNPLKAESIRQNIAIRKSNLNHAEKQALMAKALRSTMLALSAELNIRANILDDNTVLKTDTPLERAA